MLELQNNLDDNNFVELSTREKSATKRKFLFPTNVTILAALLKSVPVECKDVLLRPRLVKRADVNCVTYKANKERYIENLCLLKAIRFHKTGTESLDEETSKFLDQYLDINPNVAAEKFRDVAFKDQRIFE